MIPFDFDYYRPTNIDEAINISNELKTSGKKTMYYGGGTEFISMARLNNIFAHAVIDIKGIPECRAYGIQGDELVIGVGVSLTQVAELNLFPLLSLTVKRIADHTVQDKITMGGNLMGSIIYKEASLPLLVANSDVLIANTNGVSRIPFKEYWEKEVELKEGDLVIQLIINKKYLDLPHAHVKRTKNEKIDYPLISTVALKDGDDINIAFSGLCDTSFRSFDIEETLNNSDISLDSRINKIINQIPYEILDDISGTSEYRKFMLSKVLEEIIEKLEVN